MAVRDADRGVTDFRQDATDAATTRYGNEIGERPVTIRGGKIRSEGVNADGTPKTWHDAVDAFREYVRDKQRFKQRFSEGVEPMSHRFSDAYARSKCGRVYGADERIREEYDDPRLCLVTLTGHPWNDNGHSRCPVDFMDDLLESNDRVIGASRRHLDEYARVSVLGGHRHGHAHQHHCLWINTDKPEEELRLDLRSAVEAHLRNSPIARRKDHERGGGCIRIGYADADTDEPSWLAKEAVSQFVGWEGILDKPLGIQRFATALFLSGRQQFRPDDEFRRFVRESQDTEKSEDKGEFVGIEIERDDGTTDTIPAEELGGNPGNETETVEPLPDSLDPVSSSN